MSIVNNRKATFEYEIEEHLEAGLVLEGWEVKAIRSGRAQLQEAYVTVKNGTIVLFGCHITPLDTAPKGVDPRRTRPLLLHKKEISTLIGKVQRDGYTLIPLNLHYLKNRIKLEVGLAKGKKQHDKRAAIKEREWNRDKQRLLKIKVGT